MGLEMNPRPIGWTQMTYTSADSVAGAQGGWGVKEVGAGAGEALVAELRQGVTTRIEEVVETSNFASDSQLHDRPRRLLARSSGDRVTMWHAAAAGPDATGRPGNVFTHAAHQESYAAQLRPIDYWRSPSWLAPFGASEVTSARLPGDLLPGSAVTRDSVEAFVRADMERLFVLEWLLAATAHALESRVTLALGVDSPDEGALWLGAISYLTSPAQARRLSWVTFERASGVAELAAQGLTIVCVPRSDLPAVQAASNARVLALDPSWSLDENHATWQTPDATFPAAPEWQNAMLDAFALGSPGTGSVLKRVDEITWRLSDDDARDLPLSWPLWMAMLADDRQVEDRSERVMTCLARTPASMMTSAEVQALIAEISSGPGALEEFLAVPNLSPAVADQLQLVQARNYLDGGWRQGRPPPRISPTTARLLKVESVALVGQSLLDAVTDANAAPEQVVPAARLVTFVVGHDIDPPPDSDTAETSPGQDAVEGLLSRLEDPATPLSEEERSAARADLLTATGRPDPALSSTVNNSWGDSWDDGAVGGTVPPDVRAATVSHTTEKPVFDPPRILDDGWPTPEPVLAPTTGIGSPDLVEALETLLEATPVGSDRSEAIVDCLLLVHGLGNVPLRGGFAGIEAARDTATDLMRDPGKNARLQDKLLRWLVVYWALAELGEAQPGSGPVAVPSWLLDLERPDREMAVDELAAFLRDPSTSVGLARSFFRHAKRRDLPPDKSLLGQPFGQTRNIGWAAVDRAFISMEPGRSKAIKSTPRAQPGETYDWGSDTGRRA